MRINAHEAQTIQNLLDALNAFANGENNPISFNAPITIYSLHESEWKVEWDWDDSCWKAEQLEEMTELKPPVKPPAYVYEGVVYDYYLNHGNTWQTKKIGIVDYKG